MNVLSVVLELTPRILKQSVHQLGKPEEVMEFELDLLKAGNLPKKSEFAAKFQKLVESLGI